MTLKDHQRFLVSVEIECVAVWMIVGTDKVALRSGRKKIQHPPKAIGAINVIILGEVDGVCGRLRGQYIKLQIKGGTVSNRSGINDFELVGMKPASKELLIFRWTAIEDGPDLGVHTAQRFGEGLQACCGQ